MLQVLNQVYHFIGTDLEESIIEHSSIKQPQQKKYSDTLKVPCALEDTFVSDDAPEPSSAGS